MLGLLGFLKTGPGKDVLVWKFVFQLIVKLPVAC